MGLKRRNRVSPNFSMASMTDVIFLLLIFFMITSTVVSPNAIKVLLPQGKQQTSAKPLTRVVIDKDLNFYAAFGNEKRAAGGAERSDFIFCRVVQRRNRKCMWHCMQMNRYLIVRL